MALTTSILSGGTNSFNTTSEMVNFPVTDFIYPGVVGHLTNTSLVAPMTGSFAVNAQGTPDMTVAVSAGACYVTATPAAGNSQVFRVKNSASANVAIAANATGGTRYDWLYVKVDATNAANPDSSASNVATLVASRSTSNTTDNGTPPTYGTLIDIVTVANGASSITNGNIADRRVNAGFRNDNATSEVNSISYASAATGNSPTISAVGQDANIDLTFALKGTGKLKGVVNNLYNPYKFSVYRNAVLTTVSSAETKLAFDTKEFDTSSNFDVTTNYRFTAPAAGFYHLSARFSIATSSVVSFISLYKNGSPFKRGDLDKANAEYNGVNLSVIVQAAANDYYEIYYYAGGALAMEVGAVNCYFQGYLLSAT